MHEQAGLQFTDTAEVKNAIINIAKWKANYKKLHKCRGH